MSTPNPKRLSQGKQVKSALERIDSLEQELPRIVMAVNEALVGQNEKSGQLANIVEAVVELFGAATVDAKIKEISDRKTMANLEAAKAKLTEAIQKGDVVKADAISDKSLVVGKEYDKDGNVLFPGRAQLQFGAIKQEFQDKLLGNGVGFTLETGNGGKFEVTEVYDVVEKPAPTEVTEVPEAATTTSAANEG